MTGGSGGQVNGNVMVTHVPLGPHDQWSTVVGDGAGRSLHRVQDVPAAGSDTAVPDWCQ
ncbi:hypothetical protein ACFRLW_43445 [Streptomyces sp. NPDC056728]